MPHDAVEVSGLGSNAHFEVKSMAARLCMVSEGS